MNLATLKLTPVTVFKVEPGRYRIFIGQNSEEDEFWGELRRNLVTPGWNWFYRGEVSIIAKGGWGTFNECLQHISEALGREVEVQERL